MVKFPMGIFSLGVSDESVSQHSLRCPDRIARFKKRIGLLGPQGPGLLQIPSDLGRCDRWRGVELSINPDLDRAQRAQPIIKWGVEQPQPDEG